MEQIKDIKKMKIYQKCFIDFTDETITKHVNKIAAFKYSPFDHGINQNELQGLGKSIETIWKLPAIQQIYKYRTTMQFYHINNMKYYFDKITQIMKII